MSEKLDQSLIVCMCVYGEQMITNLYNTANCICDKYNYGSDTDICSKL